MLALVCGALYAGCSGEDERAYLESGDTPPDEPDDGDGDPNDPPDEPDASTNTLDAGGSDVAHDAGGDAGDASTVIVYSNCGEAVCAGTKKCVEKVSGAVCECDEGFVSNDLGGGNFECNTDISCVKVEPLDGACRQNVHGAVYQAFTLQYCSGEPYPPNVINLMEGFSLSQDGNAVDPNESYWTFRTNDVEQMVVLALDVSGSVINDAVRFEPLVQSVRNFVQALRPGPLDPAIFFGMILFGRSDRRYIEMTTDLDFVDSELVRLQTGGADATDVDPGGTALYSAVVAGLGDIGLLQNARDRVSGRPLSHGTLVVVTDGENQSGSTVRPDVKDSPTSVMSMGISINISDSVLAAIGKDGSFLAPNQQDWENTLTEMARRIRARSDSVYEVSYCSPATQGNHSITTGLADPTLTANKLQCPFDADDFTGSTSQECITFVNTECDEPQVGDQPPQCGGNFQACPYTCAAGDLCIEQTCVAPQ